MKNVTLQSICIEDVSPPVTAPEGLPFFRKASCFSFYASEMVWNLILIESIFIEGTFPLQIVISEDRESNEKTSESISH